jgi:transposase
MRTKTYCVRLSTEQRTQLEAVTSKGAIKVRRYKRALILLLADETPGGKVPIDKALAEQTGVALGTVRRTRRRFAEEGLEAALGEKPRCGRPLDFTGEQRAKITALACSDPPKGQSHWSLRLLADKLVELSHVETISHMTVQRVLKKTTSNPT